MPEPRIMTAQELMQEPREIQQQVDTEYWRAYRDGWIEAIEVLHDLMDAGRSFQEAYDELFSRWERGNSDDPLS